MAKPNIIGSPSGFDGGGAAFTIGTALSHTITAGAKAVIVFAGCWNGSSNPTQTCTLNGFAMAQVVAASNPNQQQVTCWIMEDTDANWPGAGAFDIVVTNSIASQLKLFAANVDDIDSATPYINTATQVGNLGATSLSLTGDAGELAISFVLYYPNARSVGAGQTDHGSFLNGTSSANAYLFEEVGTNPVVLDASFSGTSNFAQIGVSFRGAAAGGVIHDAIGSSAGISAASGILTFVTAPGNFIDDFEGADGPLGAAWTTANGPTFPPGDKAIPTSVLDVLQVAGRYRGNLQSNASNITLHFNNAQGRLDCQLMSFPFEAIAINIGIGTVANSQIAPTPDGSQFIFAGLQIHHETLTQRDSAHVVVGHRGGTQFTVEGKNTVGGVSAVNDVGADSAPLGRADIRIVGSAAGALTVYWRLPGASTWILYNGTGNLPGTAPTFGANVYVGLITYAQGTLNLPFVGTCDEVTSIGGGTTFNPAWALNASKVGGYSLA